MNSGILIIGVTPFGTIKEFGDYETSVPEMKVRISCV